jgi:O-antigen/teichoic acid export membrane protein
LGRAVETRVGTEGRSRGAAAPAISIVVVTPRPWLGLARLLRSLSRAEGIEQTEVLLGLTETDDPEPARRLVARLLPWVVAYARPVADVPHTEARNRVVLLASAPVIVFLDDDAEVKPDFLRRVREVMSDDGIAAAGGPNLTPPDASEAERLVGRVLESPIGTGPVRHRYRSGPSGRGNERNLTLTNLAVRRSAVVGAMFDGRLEGGEENDLLARLEQADARVEYRPELGVLHHRRDRLRAYVQQVRRYGFGRGQLLVRAFDPRQLQFLLPAVAVFLALVSAAVHPLILALAAGAYLAMIVGGAVHLGRFRHGPKAFALLASTHFGYITGVLAGALSELGRALVDRGSEGRRSPTARDAAGTFAALGLAVGAASVAGIVIARALGPDGRGLFELARTLALASAVVAGLGLGRAAIFLHGRARIERGELFGAVAGVLLLGTVSGGALAAVLLTNNWHGLDRVEIALTSASLPLIAFYFQGHYALRGIGKEAWYRRLLAVRDGFFLVLLPAALAIELSLTLVIGVWVIHWLLGAVVVALLLARACGRPRRPAHSWRPLSVFGASQAAVALLLLVHMRLDVLILGWFDDSAEVGQFAVALGVAEPLSYGGLAIGLVLFPRTVMTTAADPTGGYERTKSALLAAVALALSGAVVLGFVAPTLIDLLFGGSFSPAVDPLRLLLPAVVALAAILVLQSDLTGRGRIWEVVAVQTTALVTNAVLALALIPQFGASGAAVASSMSYVLAAGLLAVIFRHATSASKEAPAGILDQAGVGIS